MLQVLVVALVVISAVLYVTAQAPIPSRPLGFVYNNGSHSAPIHIDAFIDLECPDCKNAFPILEQVADFYGKSVIRLKFLVFPLPYHRNSHFSAIVSMICICC